MTIRFDLESQIMGSWNVVDDLDLLYELVTEADQLDQDQLSNILLGMRELYQLKFQKLFNAFENYVNTLRNNMENRDTQFSVAWINWVDNDLVIERIWAQNWREAVFNHSGNLFGSVEDIPEDIDDAKHAAFDLDGMFDSIEI